jgi:hypothetical protein
LGEIPTVYGEGGEIGHSATPDVTEFDFTQSERGFKATLGTALADMLASLVLTAFTSNGNPVLQYSITLGD